MSFNLSESQVTLRQPDLLGYLALKVELDFNSKTSDALRGNVYHNALHHLRRFYNATIKLFR